MKSRIFVVVILLFCMGFVLADNETNYTNVTEIVNVTEIANNVTTTITETVSEYSSNILTYDWYVGNDGGASVIYFENSKELQENKLTIISDSERRISVKCVSRGDENDLCPFLVYDQNFVAEESKNIIQKYELSLLLYDTNKYSSELIFTDDKNVSMSIIVYAVPKSEFDFDGSVEIFGTRFLATEVAMVISLIIVILIGASVEMKFWKLILLLFLWLVLSFIVYLIISFI